MHDWLWKFKSNPNFDPSMILLAEVSGRVVACLHRSPMQMTWSRGMVLKASSEGDMAVVPEYQRRRIGRTLMWSQHFGDAVLTRGFTTPSAHKRIYSKLGGVLVHSSTKRYERLMTARPLARRASWVLQLLLGRVNGDRLRSVRFVLQLIISGNPPVSLIIRGGRIGIVEGSGQHPDVTIRWTRCASRSIHNLGPARLIIGLLSGHIRIQGSPTGLYYLLKLLRVTKSMSLLVNPFRLGRC